MKRAFTLILILTALVSFVYAQNQNAPSSDGTTGTTAAGQTSTTSAAESQGAAAGQAPVVSIARQKASEIIGYSIVDSKGDKIGSMKDLIITSDGAVPYATADFNDVKANGDIIVPVKAFTFGNEKNAKQATLEIDVRQLQGAPAVQKDALGSGWDQTASSFWSGKVPGMESAQAAGGQTYLASKLLGYQVRGSDNKNIGSVKDFMIDLDKDQVAYVAMGVGGFLGAGENLFAVPMSDFQIDTQKKDLALNANKTLFDGAKGFDPNNWPVTASASWQQDIQSQKQALGAGKGSTSTAAGGTTESTMGATGTGSASTDMSGTTTSTTGTTGGTSSTAAGQQ